MDELAGFKEFESKEALIQALEAFFAQKRILLTIKRSGKNYVILKSSDLGTKPLVAKKGNGTGGLFGSKFEISCSSVKGKWSVRKCTPLDDDTLLLEQSNHAKDHTHLSDDFSEEYLWDHAEDISDDFWDHAEIFSEDVWDEPETFSEDVWDEPENFSGHAESRGFTEQEKAKILSMSASGLPINCILVCLDYGTNIF